jgi:hypothetical protein
MPTPTNDVRDSNQLKLSWLAHQAAAAKVDISKTYKRGINADAMMLRTMWHLRELAQHRDGILEPLNADYKKRYNDASKDLPSKLEALMYASAEAGKLRLELPGVATDTLRQLDKRGKELEEIGMIWMKVLSQLNKVSKQRIAAIEAGAGYMDRAGDLVAISESLDTHWKMLDPIMQSADADAAILSRADLVEMNKIATQISDVIVSRRADEAVAGVDWKQQVFGCLALCEQDWDIIRTSARFYFDRIKDKELHKSLIMLRGMTTFSLRP